MMDHHDRNDDGWDLVPGDEPEVMSVSRTSLILGCEKKTYKKTYNNGSRNRTTRMPLTRSEAWLQMQHKSMTP